MQVDVMLNKEIYNKLPQENRLANNGVAEVSEDHSESAQQVLRYELESFVCDGQYEKGLETILDKFLLNLDSRTEQPGVWISGFYGSGKSHLAKMLRTLWTDYKFSDGATARGLASIPESVLQHFKELTVQSRRFGGLHAAAGKLGAGAGDKVRMALLGIVFKSAGLPEQYNQAQLMMWLKSEGLLETVSSELHAVGRTLAQELPHMYVSQHLAKAILNARPGLANSEPDMRKLLKEQFPQTVDVTNEQMTQAIERALIKDGQFPLTLVVLDEVQQYIGNDAEKAYQVQEITETLSKHFNGKLLFVGTGQSALSGMPALQRLLGRFPVQIQLGDWDVENVTRQIILAKKPSLQPQVEKVRRDNLGEISRHLRGTKLEHVTDDESVMTQDYPLLPVRRRFWERVLRTIDSTGTVSQLRSQLRVVHEAVLATAEKPVGHVVAGDFLYDQISSSLVSTAQLSKEVYENVQRFAAGDESEKLKSQLLKLIYLINKLPTDAALDIGLKATEHVLADLLVTNLSEGSAQLRGKIPALLEELQITDRLVMSINGADGVEYRLQTRESSAWYDEYRAQEAEFKAAPQRVEQKRVDLLKARVGEYMRKVRAVQGKENIERSCSVSYDDTLPRDSDKNLYVWVQDGWQSEERSVIAEASAKSANNPTIFVFIPAQHKTELANAIVSLEAAKTTLQRKGRPQPGSEAEDAMRSIESRQISSERDLKEQLDLLFAGVRVFQAGGQEVTEGSELSDKVNYAAKVSVARLYNEFGTADQANWGKALEEARKGNQECLKAIAHEREVDQHPVCAKLLAFIGPGKKGSEIRDNFNDPPYGWSRDAIDGAIYALLVSGHIKAQDASLRAVDAKSLDRAKLTQASFQRESVTLSVPQLLKIRGVFSKAGVSCQPKEELAKLPQLLARLKELAQSAGGVPPAPPAPKLDSIPLIEGQSGNAQLFEVFNHAQAIADFVDQCQTQAKELSKRQPAWASLSQLIEHAKDLQPYTSLKAEIDAVRAQQSLLVNPDPVKPLLDSAVELLRASLNKRVQDFNDKFEELTQQLESDADWRKLSPEQQQTLWRSHNLGEKAAVDTSSAESLQDCLDACNLEHWGSKTQALGSRFDAARLSAVQLLKPNVVYFTLPKRTLNNEDELAVWLAETEQLLKEKLKQGPVSLS